MAKTSQNAHHRCTAVHCKQAWPILFTWEFRDRARRKRWFYVNLKRVIDELPPKSWAKVGGLVYLVEERCSHEFRELLKSFEGPELGWREFGSKPNADRWGMHGRALEVKIKCARKFRLKARKMYHQGERQEDGNKS